MPPPIGCLIKKRWDVFFTPHWNCFPIRIGRICRGVSYPCTTAAPLLLLLFRTPAPLLLMLLLLRAPALLLLPLLLLLFRTRRPVAPALLHTLPDDADRCRQSKEKR
jgi:hypothetical protein